MEWKQQRWRQAQPNQFFLFLFISALPNELNEEKEKELTGSGPLFVLRMNKSWMKWLICEWTMKKSKEPATPFLSINPINSSTLPFVLMIDGWWRNGGACSATQRKTKEPITSISGPGPHPTPPWNELKNNNLKKIEVEWRVVDWIGAGLKTYNQQCRN